MFHFGGAILDNNHLCLGQCVLEGRARVDPDGDRRVRIRHPEFLPQSFQSPRCHFRPAHARGESKISQKCQSPLCFPETEY
ncbi:hypothetical protein LFML04_0528 [Leptospirillum ferriphilum ML-04]|uniref:Uncharacterized protein n=1 Tax=Leptospirillum ferriphilum (strain ML-04) TaxID=1048260 RepID=J9Z8F9_LEPFM|nr:hypothetical protein LFML04_0528 [Leptospirillum ferriphilum ML-04]